MFPLYLSMVLVAAAPAVADRPASFHQPIRLAMPGLGGPNLSEAEGEFYAEHLANQLTGRGLQVTTSKQIATVLGMERQRQLLGCSEDAAACLTELANALGADAILSGEVGKLDGCSVQLNLKVLASDTGAVLATSSLRATGAADALDQLTWAARGLSAELSQRLKRFLPPPSPAVLASEETARRPLRRTAWVPAVAGGLALGGAGVLYALSNDKYRALQADAGTIHDTQARALRDQGGQLQLSSAVAAAVAVAALATSVTLYLWQIEPPGVTAGVTLAPGAVTLSGSFR
jgi:hypothetical protein